ncbi:unnamed protein product [Mytilus coruscus]|uniref:CCHC-type domain-containing protein n=1 Tax=Mytilus coruscus TaxID=42192 RepID=A0A6J8EYT8_MYTCO|nr:unnamed protein product [Mytilus coruscus]
MANSKHEGVKTPPVYFISEMTVLVDVGDNKSVKPESIIDCIEIQCGGNDCVAACVPKSGNAYEITLKDERHIDCLKDGVEFAGKTFECQELVSKYKVVSIMNLSCYVTDDEIRRRFIQIGVEIVSDIKRHCYKETNIADGTRIIKVKLPAHMSSMPYTMKFYHTATDFAFYRVIHNQQQKVCSKCFSTDHLFKNCPEFTCYSCDEQGHFRKNCPHPACRSCNLVLSKCTCERESHFVFHGAKSGKRKSQTEPHFDAKRTFEGTKNNETVYREEAPSPDNKNRAQDEKSTLTGDGNSQTQIDDDDNDDDMDTLKLDDNDGEDIETDKNETNEEKETDNNETKDDDTEEMIESINKSDEPTENMEKMTQTLMNTLLNKLILTMSLIIIMNKNNYMQGGPFL